MSESESLTPRDQAERVALFRAELIGAVSRRELSRGELAAALRALAAERYLPPGSKTLRYFGVSTFERWLYAYRAHGLAGLRPAPRSESCLPPTRSAYSTRPPSAPCATSTASPPPRSARSPRRSESSSSATSSPESSRPT